IRPLQDAVDLGIATDEEIQKLGAWKRYRVEINRIDTSNLLDISWPLPPDV
ncbi:TPA: tail fiber assembly protein, partial [Salmonella enterica subsp. enterica serovar Bovismorbificans]